MKDQDSINRIYLLGEVQDEPRLIMKNKKQWCLFTLLTREPLSGGKGIIHEERHEVLYRAPERTGTGPVIRKTDTLIVQGRIRTERRTDEQGIRRYHTRIISQQVSILPGDPDLGS